MTHPIENIVRITMENLDHIAEADTVIGAPVRLDDGSTVLPVSRVALGFVTGGGEYNSKRTSTSAGEASCERPALPFLGTSAAGVGLSPVAFLSVREGRISVLPAESNGALDRLVSMLPELLQTAERLCKSMQMRAQNNGERCK